jgi:hypothetical protein
MHISLLLLAGLLAAVLVVGVFFGWNNGKSSTIAKIESETKTLVGDAAKTVSSFWTTVKAKL